MQQLFCIAQVQNSFASSGYSVIRNGIIEYADAARLRPELMTAFVAIMAFAPLDMGIGTGTQPHQPLAIALIGGLVFALPLLLVELPTWLRRVGRKGWCVIVVVDQEPTINGAIFPVCQTVPELSMT